MIRKSKTHAAVHRSSVPCLAYRNCLVVPCTDAVSARSPSLWDKISGFFFEPPLFLAA